MTTQDSHTEGIQFHLAPWQAVALYTPIVHFCMYAGVAAGKTFTGAHFAIDNILKHPDCTGFIGANTYDQLSQVALRELFYWLDFYKLDWVIDKLPPPEWGGYQRKFKSYKNVLSVRHPRSGIIVHCFTRVLGKGDPLRGLEFSWYWIDETRDTPQNTHDILLSRLRESGYVKGLVTTTTNGKDWSYDRFKRGADNQLYGCMHVPTEAAVNLGIQTRAYYDTLLRSYSPLLAQQELFAKHVNIKTGRAYYAASENNRRARAPWGDRFPDKTRPLIIGCDFNFSPAPCIWMVGQLGPNWWLDRKGFAHDLSHRIHWYGEIVNVETSSPDMTRILLNQYPDFSHYSFYGDASGGIGTTSNAGETDYIQMAEVCREYGVSFSMDYDQRNPLVRDRVENMNAKFGNAMNEIAQTYNPEACPNFDQDVSDVGWKPTTQRGRGKLDDGGDTQRTHATDGAGYAVWKLLPPAKVGFYIDPVKSQASAIRSGAA